LRISSFANGECVGEAVATGLSVGLGLNVGALVPENGAPLGDGVGGFFAGGGALNLPAHGTLLKHSSPLGQLL